MSIMNLEIGPFRPIVGLLGLEMNIKVMLKLLHSGVQIVELRYLDADFYCHGRWRPNRQFLLVRRRLYKKNLLLDAGVQIASA